MASSPPKTVRNPLVVTAVTHLFARPCCYFVRPSSRHTHIHTHTHTHTHTQTLAMAHARSGFLDELLLPLAPCLVVVYVSDAAHEQASPTSGVVFVTGGPHAPPRYCTCSPVFR